MRHLTDKFQGAGDCELFYQSWLPESDARAVVILAHGISEHSGRYQGLAGFLAENNYAVYAFDYRHHGRSAGKKGCMDNFSFILNDFKNFLKIVQKDQPGKKVFLFGHSMGAALSLAFARSHQTELEGLILSGSPLRSQPAIPTALIGLMYPLVWAAPNLGIYKLDSSTLSRDKMVVSAYDDDPLVFRGKLSSRLIISFMWGLHKIEASLVDIRIPVLVMHGGLDNLCSPEGSRLVMQKIGSSDKTFLPYNSLFHEILNEPEKDQVRRDILEWLDIRTK